jgi:lipid-binding SYLF domain-containing protein
MKKLMMTLFLVTIASAMAFAKEDQLQKATNVIDEIMSTPDKGIPEDLFKKAVCIGIVPSEIKGAILVGGSYGRGVLVCRERGDGPWGAPSNFTLGGGSFGFQIGGEATDVVFIVMNQAGARKLVRDEVKLGADISVAGGPVGRSAQGATDAELHAEILSYSRARGLFAGVSLSGAVMKHDEGADKDLYGHAVTAKEVLLEDDVRPTPEAERLDHVLAKYSPRGGEPFAEVRPEN